MIKAGVIGLGVGEQHIIGYAKHNRCQVKSICDIDDVKLNEVHNRHPDATPIVNPNDILDDPEIDVVTIASFDQYHADQIIRALNNNKHVFVEKPLCLYEKEAQEIHELLLKKPHLKISSNLILRKSPRFIELRDAISKNDYGKVFHVRGAYNYGRLHKIIDGWRSEQPFYSMIYGGGVHIVDLITWLINQRVSEVSTFGNKIMSKESNFSNFDFTSSILNFENGTIGQITCNSGCVYPHFHQLEVYGSKATFQNDHEEARKYTKRESPDYDTISSAYPGADKGDLLKPFIDNIIHNTEPIVSKKDIFDAMAVCFALEKSAHTKSVQKVNYFD